MQVRTSLSRATVISIVRNSLQNPDDGGSDTKSLTHTPPSSPKQLSVMVETPYEVFVATEQPPTSEPAEDISRAAARSVSEHTYQPLPSDLEVKVESRKILCCSKYSKIIASSPFILGSSILAWNEIKDGLDLIGKNGKIGIIPNSTALYFTINGAFIIYAFAFDGVNTYKGLFETLELVKLGELPEDWKELKLAKDVKRRRLMSAGVIVLSSTIGEVINAIDIAKGAGWPLPATCFAVPLGSLAFLFSEGIKVPDSFLKSAAGTEDDHYFLSKVLSRVFMRLPTASCAILFSFVTAVKWLGAVTPEAQLAVLIFICLSRGVTDYIYNGSYNEDVVDALFKEFVRFVNECRNANLREFLRKSFDKTIIVASLSAATLGYTLANIQQRLNEDALETLALPYATEAQNVIARETVLPYVIMFSTMQMMVNYTAVLYKPMHFLASNIGYGLNKAGSCLSSTASIISSRMGALCCWKKKPANPTPSVESKVVNKTSNPTSTRRLSLFSGGTVSVPTDPLLKNPSINGYGGLISDLPYKIDTNGKKVYILSNPPGPKLKREIRSASVA